MYRTDAHDIYYEGECGKIEDDILTFALFALNMVFLMTMCAKIATKYEIGCNNSLDLVFKHGMEFVIRKG